VFHEKAKAQGYNGPEEDYRYPGPRPQRREAGILLLADSIEAATRALKDPTAASVGARVRHVIETRVGEGELDDCNLTLRDLDIIETTFTRTLTLGVFHNRVDYPPMANPNSSTLEGDKNSDADRDHRVHPLPGVADRPA